MKPLVLVAFSEYGDKTVENEILTRELDAQIVYARSIMEPEARELAKRADAIACTVENYSAGLLATLENCKILSRFGTGLDNIDLDAAAEHGIWVTNVPDAFVEEVSTHTIALILTCNRHLFSLMSASRQGHWDKTNLNISRLSSQTLGLIGFGRIARLTAQKARGMGLNVVAYDAYVEEGVFTAHAVKSVSLEQLLRNSDYVSLHVPATATTRCMINAGNLAWMKPSAYLINTSRGALIDEDALLAAVRSNQIAGAALDVRSIEPPSMDDPLLREEHILVTPHMAWCSLEASRQLRERACMEIVRVLRGEKPENPANSPKPKIFKPG